MQRIPTPWNPNPAKVVTLTTYSSLDVTYSSATTAYSNPNAALAENGALPDVWTKPAKNATPWNPNPLATVALYVYDSGTHTYDSSVDTYDGIVVGQDFNDQETPNAWSSL